MVTQKRNSNLWHLWILFVQQTVLVCPTSREWKEMVVVHKEVQ